MKRTIVIALSFVICMAFSQNAWAASSFGLQRFGINGGLVDVQDGGSTLGLGLSADMGTIAKDVHFSFHADYWNDTEESFGAEAGIRDISFGARARYMFKMDSPKFQPYAGGGLGLHFYRASVTIPDIDLGGGVIIPGEEFSDTSTELGLDLNGGFNVPMSAKTDFTTDLTYTLSDIDQFSLKAGVSFKVGN